MQTRNGLNEGDPKARRGDSREAIVGAAERLFLDRGFGAVSMDELAEAAGVARRTLYNQFANKEDIFREMLRRVSGELTSAFPPGIETQGDVDTVLRRIARIILEVHKNTGYLGFVRMVVADSRQFPWIAQAFEAVMEPQAERFARYLAHLTTIGVLDCGNPQLAAHQFMGIVNEVSLWPWMFGRDRLDFPDEEVIEETVRMFLRHYRSGGPKGPGQLSG